jgi:ParB family chromosome partitioning protein
LIQPLPLERIATDHLVRDRMVLEDEDMQALKSSLKARGQQTPVEVVQLPEGRYGLISGWRRIEALRQMGQESVLALVRSPQTADAAYVAMIEENEIRAGLSYYERARLAAEAVRIGVYPNVSAAVQALFANASSSKRSKILNFVAVHDSLGSVLQFPAAIPERLGLALAAAFAATPEFAARLKDTLRKTPASDVGRERATLERALKKKGPSSAVKAVRDEIASDLFIEAGKGRVTVSGKGVTEALVTELRAWLVARAG